MPRMFQWFLELHFELGNPITNHDVSLEGYFPPVGALKSSAPNAVKRLEQQDLFDASALPADVPHIHPDAPDITRDGDTKVLLIVVSTSSDPPLLLVCGDGECLPGGWLRRVSNSQRAATMLGQAVCASLSLPCTALQQDGGTWRRATSAS